MAIDTLERRVSALGFGRSGTSLPVPDATIGTGDRATLAGLYSGIALTAPVVIQPDVTPEPDPAAPANLLVQDATYDAADGSLYDGTERPRVWDNVQPVVATWRFKGIRRLDDPGGVILVNSLRYNVSQFHVTVHDFPADNLPCTLELYARMGYALPSAPWSNANFPPSRIQSGTFPTRQLEADLEQSLVIKVSSRTFYTVPTGTLTFELDKGALGALPNHPLGWDGALNLFMVGLFPSGASGVTWKDFNTDGAGATVTLNYSTADVTGMSTDRMQALGRARRCPRCARFMLSDDFVRDGELRFFVCPWCYDERQVPRNVGRRETPPINEG